MTRHSKALLAAVSLYGGEGVTPSLAHKRIYVRGWSFGDAVSTPKLRNGQPRKGIAYRNAACYNDPIANGRATP